MEEVTVKWSRIGWREGWFAYRGNKVLCDRLVRVRRFLSEQAAMKAGLKADPAEFR